jgi:hypothetical protein
MFLAYINMEPPARKGKALHQIILRLAFFHGNQSLDPIHEINHVFFFLFFCQSSQSFGWHCHI